MANNSRSSSYNASGGSVRRIHFNDRPNSGIGPSPSPSRPPNSSPGGYRPQTPLKSPISPVRPNSCTTRTAETRKEGQTSADWDELVELLAMYVQQRQESQSVEQQLSDLIIQRDYIQKSSSDYSSAPAFIRADIKRQEDKKASLSIKTNRTQQELRSSLNRLCETKTESWKEARSTSPTGDDASKFHTMEQTLAACQSKTNDLEAKFTKTQASELRMSKVMDQALANMVAMGKQLEDLKCKTQLLEAKQEENEREKEIRQLTNTNKKRDDEILSVQAELNREKVESLRVAVKKLESTVGNLEATKLGDSEKRATDLSKTFLALRKKYGMQCDSIRGEIRQIKEDVDASHKNCVPSNNFEVAVNNIVQSRMSTVDNWMQGVDHGMLNMDAKLQEILTIWQRSAATSTPNSVQEGLRGDYRPNKRPRTDS